jgi:hypothetical protein
MRTTLDIDADVLLAAKELGRRERKTAGKVISEMARKGMFQAAAPALNFADCFEPIPSRGVVVTDELIRRLLEEDQSSLT